jgi:hypothetical protein
LRRELKANARLFSYFFADRHEIQENETMKLTGELSRQNEM